MSREWDFMDELNEENYPIKKVKRIKNEYKRNKIRNNQGRSRGGQATDQGSEGADY